MSAVSPRDDMMRFKAVATCTPTAQLYQAYRAPTPKTHWFFAPSWQTIGLSAASLMSHMNMAPAVRCQCGLR